MTGLSLRKPCGEKECPEYHMCQAHDLQCYPCHSYCNETSHNYDVKICQQQCQDYIHDYVKHYVKDINIQDVLQELETLKSLIIWLTLLVIVAIVIMSVMMAFVWKRERKIPMKHKNAGKDSYFKKKLAFLKFRNNTVNTVSETVDTKPWTVAAAATTTTTMMAAHPTDAPKASSASSSSGGHRTSRTTVSSSSTSTSSTDKLPCEDATLVTQEFTGYDNLGLCKVSPVLCSKPAATATMKMYGATDVDLLHRYSP